VQKSKKNTRPVPVAPGSEKRRTPGFTDFTPEPELQVSSENNLNNEMKIDIKNRNENEAQQKESEKETDFTVLSKATMKLKNMLSKNNKSNTNNVKINLSNINNDIISENNFPPLPNKSGFLDTRISGYENEKESVVIHNYSSSGDNSTDREEGSLSSDSSSPRYKLMYIFIFMHTYLVQNNIFHIYKFSFVYLYIHS
jgi:hypothetical protein